MGFIKPQNLEKKLACKIWLDKFSFIADQYKYVAGNAKLYVENLTIANIHTKILSDRVKILNTVFNIEN